MKLAWASKLFKAPPARLDWVLFAATALGCYLVFEHNDIISTGAASLVFLQGHILDFYEEVRSIFSANAGYLPSTYILYALWNIPIRLLGLTTQAALAATPFAVLMWYKLLPTAFYMACALVIYQMALQIGLGPTRSRLAAYIWLTTPIAFFSQFIFGQYDSLGLFFLLLGLLFYFRGNLSAFAVLCGAAFTFKYFPAFIFLPLLLLREKRVGAIFRLAALFALPVLLVILPFLGSSAFREGVFTYRVAGYIWKPSIWNGYLHIQLVVVGLIVAGAWAYFVEVASKRDLVNWSSSLPIWPCSWHSVWVTGIRSGLCCATPFWVLSTFMNRRMPAFLVLDIVMMLFFVAMDASRHGNVHNLFALGILKDLAVPVMTTVLPVRQMFLFPDPSFVFSACSGLMLVQAIFKHPRFCAERPNRTALPTTALIRTRFLGGVGIFVLPVFLSLFFGLARRPAFFSTMGDENSAIAPIARTDQAQQLFIARRTLMNSSGFHAIHQRRKTASWALCEPRRTIYRPRPLQRGR